MNIKFDEYHELSILHSHVFAVITISLSSIFDGPQQYFVHYPTGQNYSLELMLTKFVIAKIAKKLNPLKLTPNGCLMPVKNIGV